ncbi:MAG: hypothetical protein H7123_08250, partial [Thermoleophilia bacterium]|nr:hypothetical protein [Thermoleophilia bacterium]
PRDFAAATSVRNRAQARYRALSAIQPVPANLADYDELLMKAAFSKIVLESYTAVELQNYATAEEWPTAIRQRFVGLRAAAAHDARAAAQERARAGY